MGVLLAGQTHGKESHRLRLFTCLHRVLTGKNAEEKRHNGLRTQQSLSLVSASSQGSGVALSEQTAR